MLSITTCHTLPAAQFLNSIVAGNAKFGHFQRIENQVCFFGCQDFLFNQQFAHGFAGGLGQLGCFRGFLVPNMGYESGYDSR